ncbi:MAG: glycosyltransferase, partial [Phormidesmis sp. RL_2_1]|nr:glycosyltransferase [Phormidesmis sp. RL_2_1]
MRKREHPPPPCAHVFSVVIPTYNRQPILEKCLRAMEHQMLRPN